MTIINDSAIQVWINEASLVKYINILDVTKDPYYINISKEQRKQYFCTPSSKGKITYSIDNLHEVTDVVLNNCSGKGVKFVLDHLTNVENITLVNCNIKSLPSLPDTVKSLKLNLCNKIIYLNLPNSTNIEDLSMSECNSLICDDINSNTNMLPDSLQKLTLDGMYFNCNDINFPQLGRLMEITIHNTYFTNFTNLPQNGLTILSLKNTGITSIDSKLPSCIQKLSICKNILLNYIDSCYLPPYISYLYLAGNNITSIDTTSLQHEIIIKIEQDMPIKPSNIKKYKTHTISQSGTSRHSNYFQVNFSNSPRQTIKVTI